jgi:hypothetical protein
MMGTTASWGVSERTETMNDWLKRMRKKVIEQEIRFRENGRMGMFNELHDILQEIVCKIGGESKKEAVSNKGLRFIAGDRQILVVNPESGLFLGRITRRIGSFPPDFLPQIEKVYYASDLIEIGEYMQKLETQEG